MFQAWTDLEIKEAVNSTHLREFPPGAVIAHGEPDHGEVRHVFILVKGQCRVIRKLPVVHTPDGLLRLARRKGRRGGRGASDIGAKQLLVTSEKIGPGLVFSRDSHRKAVISDRRVVCLMLAEAMLARVTRAQGAQTQLMRSQQHRMLVASDSEVFACYNQTQTWDRFREVVLQKTLAALKAPQPHQFPATLRVH